jgi:transposase InsO family protein
MRDERGQQETWSLDTFQSMNSRGLLQTDVSGAIGPQYSDQSKEAIARAQTRLNALRNRDLSVFSQASLDRFAARTRTARNELEALMLLVDEIENRGNRQPRTDERTEEVIERAIKEKYNTKECPTQLATYKYYVGLCERLEVEEPDKPRPFAVSKTTFFLRLKAREDVRARKGKRVAYQAGAIVVPGSNDLPVHGVVPHGVCYIDHTQINLATVSGNDPGLSLDKPWKSIATDGCTTQARALLLMYDPPSAATVLLLLRDYVRRNGRLPKVLSLDNGKDLKSQSLREVCRLYGIDLRFRPPGQPRGAAPVEAAIGASEIECISNLEGNTRSLKDARLTTKSVNGFNFAVHTLVSAYNILEEYYFVTREHRICAALGVTPAEYEAQRKREAGAREHVVIRYDETLMLLTSPYAKRPMHIVCPRRGVWVDGMWYAHSDLRGLPRGTKVEVRVEPFSVRVVYVCVKGRWKAAVGINSRQLDGRTRREVSIAAREHQKRSGTAAKKDRESGNGWISTDYAPELYDPRIAERQREQKYLLDMNKLLGALKPEMAETGDDQEFDLMRNPTRHGMHVGKAAAPGQPLWLPAPAEASEVGRPQAPAPEEDRPSPDAPRSAHQQQEDVLFDAALEEFL